jgi:hypothetical protein
MLAQIQKDRYLASLALLNDIPNFLGQRVLGFLF